MPLNLNPLTPDQRVRFRSAANDASPKRRLVGLVGLDTGLRRDAIAHIHGDWWHPYADPPYIKVPGRMECDIGWEEVGKPDTQGTPCYYCKDDQESGPSGIWTPKTENSERRVFVSEPDTREIIEKWFTLNETVCSHRTINTIVEDLAKEAGIDRKVTPHHLRQTYGTKLAENGFTAYEIKNLMGHSSIKQADDYVQMYGTEIADAYKEKWE